MPDEQTVERSRLREAATAPGQRALLPRRYCGSKFPHATHVRPSLVPGASDYLCPGKEA